MGTVVRKLPDNLWTDLGVPFQGRVTPLGEILEKPSLSAPHVIYATPGLSPNHPNAAILKANKAGEVAFTVGNQYARLGDRPEMAGEIKRGARAFRNFIRENPSVYYNNPYMSDGFGDSRAKFYRSQGFVDSPSAGVRGGTMVLDSRIYAPLEDQQAYAHLNRYLMSSALVPLAAKSRTKLSGSKTDPWSSIPEPQVYDSSGARIDIPSGAFGTLARAAVSKQREIIARNDIEELIDEGDSISSPLAMSPSRPAFYPGVAEFPELVHGSPTNRGFVDAVPATWVVPRAELFPAIPSYASPVPIANPLDVTPARRQELARLGYTDPNQWFLRYYGAPEGKLRYFQNNALPDWVANNDAWEWR